MAEKATLMLEAAKKNEEIEKLTAAVEKATQDLRAIPVRLTTAKQEARANAQASFNRRQEELRSRVEGVISKRRSDLIALVDTFPELDTKEFAGRFEIKELESHLMEVYPAEMIEDYVCMNPIQIEDDEEAFRIHSSVENAVMSLNRGGGLSASIFTSINDTLDKLTEDPRVGLKIIPVILIFYAVGVMFVPFIFLTTFSLIGLASAVQGAFVKSLLRKLYSVKLYLNTSYDEDVFQKDKTDIIGQSDDYFDYARNHFMEVIAERKFHYDLKEDERLDKQFDLEKKKIEQTRDLNNTALQKLKEEQQAILKRLDEIEEEERQRAVTARQTYLSTITWKHEWMEQVFIDITPENKRIMMPFLKGNSCYYSQDEDQLKKFSRLAAYQALIHMHPEYATQVVLDYKYMGGELIQFISLEGKAIKLCYSEDDIRKQVDIINNEIKARTKSILSSSANLDEFNALMASYNAAGEYYAVIHIFGLESITTAMKSWFRNGPRVGYLFKFYWTHDEMKALKDDLPFADIKDYYEIGDTPIPRTAATVKRIIGLDS